MSSSHVIFKIIIIKIINIKINCRCVCAATERGYGARLNPVITSNTPHCKFSISFIKIFQSFTVFLPSAPSLHSQIFLSFIIICVFFHFPTMLNRHLQIQTTIFQPNGHGRNQTPSPNWFASLLLLFLLHTHHPILYFFGKFCFSSNLVCALFII